MKTLLAASTIAVLAFAGNAIADGHASGDPESGLKQFNKCKSCHMVADPDGETFVKGGRTGPNLWNVIGRTAGTEDFKYSDAMVEAGEAGLVWDEAQFIEYVADPTPYLRAYLDDSKARGKMAFKLKKAEDAADIWAYLASVSAAPES